MSYSLDKLCYTRKNISELLCSPHPKWPLSPRVWKYFFRGSYMVKEKIISRWSWIFFTGVCHQKLSNHENVFHVWRTIRPEKKSPIICVRTGCFFPSPDGGFFWEKKTPNKDPPLTKKRNLNTRVCYYILRRKKTCLVPMKLEWGRNTVKKDGLRTTQSDTANNQCTKLQNTRILEQEGVLCLWHFSGK